LATHNFFSAAAGMAVAVALVRGFARHVTDKIGNFWVDLTRATLYVLVPMSLLVALAFAGQGVIQNFDPYTKLTTVEGGGQTIAQGPIASQEAIKMLGTNGGGFTNANSAHPYENPTPLANFLQLLCIFVIPANGREYSSGMGAVCHHEFALLRRRCGGLGRRTVRQSGVAARRFGRTPDFDAVRRKHGRQGSPLRHRRFDLVCHRDDGRQLRRRQLHAR
jgi:hypothetical protein